MKKLLIVLSLLSLLAFAPTVADAGKPYHGDKYKVYKNKHPRVHKSDRHRHKHPNFKRGQRYNGAWYRNHYTWRQWYGGERYRYPGGRYNRHESGVMMFSYCEGGLCFSFSLGD